MNRENLTALLDGELSPSDQETAERELLTDPAALALFRELCRQRLMLAEISASSPAALPRIATGPRFRLHWQIVAATLLFAASVAVVWLRHDSGSRVVQGTVLVAGSPVLSVPADALAENPGPLPAEIALREGAKVALSPASHAVLHRSPDFVELRKGAARIRVPGGTAEVRVASVHGEMIVRGSEFSVELVPGSVMGGHSMESLLALVVSVLMGDVQVDVAGKTQRVAAGESRVFGADGAVADTLAVFLAAQDEKEKKDGEEKEKKGKKKEKKEGKDKKEDDDDKDEKNGKDNEKGKKDKGDDKEEKGKKD